MLSSLSNTFICSGGSVLIWRNSCFIEAIVGCFIGFVLFERFAVTGKTFRIVIYCLRYLVSLVFFAILMSSLRTKTESRANCVQLIFPFCCELQPK